MENGSARPMTSWDRLSVRQHDVLVLICKGMRNSEIASRLELSERSVKAYVGQLLLIFDVSNRTELAIKALGSTIH
jgi:DNA-binding CsgD family transcriptional regulator